MMLVGRLFFAMVGVASADLMAGIPNSEELGKKFGSDNPFMRDPGLRRRFAQWKRNLETMYGAKLDLNGDVIIPKSFKDLEEELKDMDIDEEEKDRRREENAHAGPSGLLGGLTNLMGGGGGGMGGGLGAGAKAQLGSLAAASALAESLEAPAAEQAKTEAVPHQEL